MGEPSNKPVTNANINTKEFDLEAYISNYTGHTKVERLIFIGEHAKDFELEAFRMAIDELKKTSNTVIYKALCEKIGDRLGPAYKYDANWAENVEKRSQQQLNRLETDLNGYKANLVKESIRMGHNELGDFYYQKGDLANALKCYVRTRDYCTTSKNIIQMCLNVVRVSIELQNYAQVLNYVSKAEQTQDLTDQTVQAKLKCSTALSNLENKKYKPAALKFLEAPFALGDFNDVMAPRDVAIYGGLCALATFDRSELKKKVIDNSGFRNFLELVPEIRELIQDFYSSRYASCLRYLEKFKTELYLDLHLHDHVESLYSKIRNKALVQYFSPFVSVDLHTMAAAFTAPVASLEKEIAKLIVDGSIQARIDSHNKRLYARHTDQRNTTFQNALQVGDDFQKNSNALILRTNIMRHDLIVKPPRRDEDK